MALPVHEGAQLKELGPTQPQTEDVSELPDGSGLSRSITGPLQVLGAFFVLFNVWYVIQL